MRFSCSSCWEIILIKNATPCARCTQWFIGFCWRSYGLHCHCTGLGSWFFAICNHNTTNGIIWTVLFMLKSFVATMEHNSRFLLLFLCSLWDRFPITWAHVILTSSLFCGVPLSKVTPIYMKPSSWDPIPILRSSRGWSNLKFSTFIVIQRREIFGHTVIGQNPSVSKSNRLHVSVFLYYFEAYSVEYPQITGDSSEVLELRPVHL
jgi:hypothetical protein